MLQHDSKDMHVSPFEDVIMSRVSSVTADCVRFKPAHAWLYMECLNEAGVDFWSFLGIIECNLRIFTRHRHLDSRQNMKGGVSPKNTALTVSVLGQCLTTNFLSDLTACFVARFPMVLSKGQQYTSSTRAHARRDKVRSKLGIMSRPYPIYFKLLPV